MNRATSIWDFTPSGNFTNLGIIDGRGGGVYLSGIMFTMNDGEIINNDATFGGGVSVGWGSTFTMTGGVISDNTTADMGGSIGWGIGGGIFIENSGTAAITSGTISNNTSGHSGGGIFIENGGMATITSGTINNNTAWNSIYEGGGGGIWTHTVAPAHLYVGSGVIFSGNVAYGSSWFFDGTPDVSSFIRTMSSSRSG